MSSMSRRQATTSQRELTSMRIQFLYYLVSNSGDIWGSFGKVRLVTEDVCAMVMCDG